MRPCLYMSSVLALITPVFAQTDPSSAVIQGGTHVVLVNLVVKDKHGKPVSGLSRDDFVVRDNGREQKISLFARDVPGSATQAAGMANDRMTFTNRPAQEGTGVTVFLFDELNTKTTDQDLAKKDFLRYLRGMAPDSRIAVFVLGDSLAMLHDFSQDMESLVADLNRHKARASTEVDAASAPPASSNSLTGDATTTAQWDSFLQSAEQQYIDYTETVRATRTAAALDTIAVHLQGIPGRKTLIWISGGFPIQIGLDATVDSIPQSTTAVGRSTGGKGGKSDGSGQSAAAHTNASTAGLANSHLPGTDRSFESDVARAIRALNEADVAVYPVDARGVMTPAAFGADRSSMGKRSKPSKTFGPPDYNYETLETLAIETGGRAFHHINDLSSAIQEAAGDSSVSYSLGFAPALANLDGSYHRLQVTVNRPGTTARYRLGYVATQDRAIFPSLTEAISNPVDLAGIGFSVHLDPVEGGYKASVLIDARNITLEARDGKWTGALQFLVVVGKTEQLTTIPLNLSEDAFRQAQAKGLALGARVKALPGSAGFSLGFRDIPSGAVGTLHVKW